MEKSVTPAGLLGTYYAARSSYGHYRSCAVTGRYIFSADQDIIKLLEHAISRTIDRHPSLCYSISDKTSSRDAAFIKLASINWNDVVVLKSASENNQDDELSKELGAQHQQQWDSNLPSWRIMVLSHKHSLADKSKVKDIAFISHHAIADGLSAAAFHKSLLQYLLEASSEVPPQVSLWPYVVPTNITNAVSLEEAIQYKPPLTHSNIPTALATDSQNVEAWTASPPYLPTIDAFISRVKLLNISASEVIPVLQQCRKLKTTLTGLLHGYIIYYLVQAVPGAQAFKATTPYSMRKLTKISSDEIANHFSYVCSDWNSSLVSSARQVAEGSDEELKFICRVSEQYFGEMRDEMEQIYTRGPHMLNAVSAIKDLDRFCQDTMSRKQGTTYELSNLGVVTVPEIPKKSAIQLEKLVFTQCGTVGLGFGCGVVSMENIVEQELMEGLCGYLKRRLQKIHTSEL